jgi:hypothetical protein
MSRPNETQLSAEARAFLDQISEADRLAPVQLHVDVEENAANAERVIRIPTEVWRGMTRELRQRLASLESNPQVNTETIFATGFAVGWIEALKRHTHIIF